MNSPDSEADVLEVWSETFPAFCAECKLTLPDAVAAEAETSEAGAARFILALLRESRWLRWRFPTALSSGEKSKFFRWLCGRGARKFNLSKQAIKKIRGAFRHRPGKRIRDIYLRDTALQRFAPLGLVPLGQRSFLGWLTSYGRADQGARDEEILWFLYESTEQLEEGFALSYLVNPEWQKEFPLALTPCGWKAFGRSLAERYPKFFHRKSLGKMPPLVAEPEQTFLERSIAPPEKTRAIAGVNILSHFCYPSGIQQAAFFAKAALEHSGVRTSCRDVPVPIRTELLDRADWLGLEIYPITIINVAPTPYFAPVYEHSGLARRENVYRIAYWNWELESIPPEWIELAALFDEIWSPTEFVAQAMRSRMPLPVFKIEPGVEVGPVESVSRGSLRIPEDHYVFLFMFDMYSEIERKNPLAVIRAFRAAFSPAEKATLVIKTSRGQADPLGLERLQKAARDNGVVLIDQVVSRAQADGFLEMCDCFVSLHRSEGFGLGLAEAMLLGKPAIATNYSGNLSFMNAGNSLLVDYTLTEIERSGPIYAKGNVWAEPSEEHAAVFMRKVYDDRSAAVSMGARAKAQLEVSLSLEGAGERMLARLRQIAAR
ncbi:MAG TPA: glycosyltransferase [Chthoniobacterales bacterium]|nr:glycosyltransferase [Chthoniobacterales bacterium]